MAHLWTRRGFGLFSGAFGASLSLGAVAKPSNTIVPPHTTLNWLDGDAPHSSEGVTLGIPYPRGAFKPNTAFALVENGKPLSTQTWPLAYWPDGSLKWLGVASEALSQPVASYELMATPAPAPKNALTVTRDSNSIHVTSGSLRWQIPCKGSSLIEAAKDGDTIRLGATRLICLTRSKPESEDIGQAETRHYTGNISVAEVEQSGPVRAVVRLDGHYISEDETKRSWLPFSVRLYFHAGSRRMRIVHSFIYDGDEQVDFISGLGLRADVPLKDAHYDRHIRFAGTGAGVWGEAVKPITGLRRDAGKAFRDAQIAGRALPDLSAMSKEVSSRLDLIPSWGDFTLSQTNAEGFSLRKRTGAGHAFIDIISDTRARGLAYIGGASGGIALGQKDFWQSAPTRLDVRSATEDTAQITSWMWSPEAEPMDLRPYRGEMGMQDFKTQTEGLNITYEDYEPGLGRPYGIARTHELSLWALDSTPDNATFSAMANEVSLAPRLVCTPSRLHQAGIFGLWSLPERTGPVHKALEDRLSYEIDYYLGQVKQRKWYGFWNFGDVMHTYDADRHAWRYDIGGFAWDNSELSTDMWLWYSYLRTGRADIFRMAEAMTRHTGEVDVYHLGPYKGFGTRHGVQHFSDSSKQPRISNAAYRRFYHYLTADERCGDLMRALNDSDGSLAAIDISRKLGEGRFPNQITCSFGTSWGSFIAAWLTEWERTGDIKWRNRIATGMRTIAKFPKGWFVGDAPYDSRTGAFGGPGDYVNFSHLNNLFGVFEIHSELINLMDTGNYDKVWTDYCQYMSAPKDEVVAFLGEYPSGSRMLIPSSRYTAYAGVKRHDPKLISRAWAELLGDGRINRPQPLKTILPPEVLAEISEDPMISTNDSAQFGLAAIQTLALIGNSLETEAANIPQNNRRGPRNSGAATPRQ